MNPLSMWLQFSDMGVRRKLYTSGRSRCTLRINITRWYIYKAVIIIIITNVTIIIKQRAYSWG